MRRLAAFAVMMALSGCGGFTEHEADAEQSWWKNFYGTNKSEEKVESDWWGRYYGSGEPQDTCSFWGRCGTSGAGAGGGVATGGGWGGSDPGHDGGSGW